MSGLPWWISNTGKIRQAATNPGAWLGPYATKADARKALGNQGGGGAGGGSAGGGTGGKITGGGGIGSCTGRAGIGTRYSYAQLEGLWIDAGGKKSLAPVMAAIAMAESGGCSSAQNPSGATGLWQINGAVNPADQGNLTDQHVNASEAVLKWKAQGLNAWVTFTSGAYKQFLRGNVPPTLNGTGPVGSGGFGGGAGGVGAGITSNTVSPACLIPLPAFSGIHIPGTATNVGQFTGGCAFSKSEARAVAGSLLLVAGSGILMVGALVLIAYGLKATGAGARAGKAAGGALEAGGAVLSVAGMPEAGVPLAAAGGAVRKQGASRAAQQAAVKRGRQQLAGRKKAEASAA